jgi:hypothetical protein
MDASIYHQEKSSCLNPSLAAAYKIHTLHFITFKSISAYPNPPIFSDVTLQMRSLASADMQGVEGNSKSTLTILLKVHVTENVLREDWTNQKHFSSYLIRVSFCSAASKGGEPYKNS